MPWRARLAALVVLVIGTGCAASVPSPSPVPTPSADATATPPPGLTLRDVDATPVIRSAAAIGMAFDAAAAVGLVDPLPATIDFGADALVCVYLGSRPTTGWGLALQSASLSDGVLEIRARETRPGGGSREEITYPADCGLVNRSALPPGPLLVRADDTISEEFITDGEVTVPPGGGSP
jgi:hypothetical protein